MAKEQCFCVTEAIFCQHRCVPGHEYTSTRTNGEQKIYPSWCPVTPSFGAARCWPSAGVLVGGQLACRQVTPGKLGCGLPVRGHRGPGPVRSRLSPPVPGLDGGRGHTCRTPPWACSVSSKSDASRRRARTCRTRCAHLGVGSRHPRLYLVHGVKMDTLGHSDAPAACIVVEGSGRAGPSEVVDACRREKK